jgi:hypothetical protein
LDDAGSKSRAGGGAKERGLGAVLGLLVIWCAAGFSTGTSTMIWNLWGRYRKMFCSFGTPHVFQGLRIAWRLVNSDYEFYAMGVFWTGSCFLKLLQYATAS